MTLHLNCLTIGCPQCDVSHPLLPKVCWMDFAFWDQWRDDHGGQSPMEWARMVEEGDGGTHG